MRLFVAIALCAALVSSAQAPSIAGVWSVTTKGAKGTTQDGGNWTIGAVSGALTLAQKGNQVTGSWKGQMPAPWALTGQLDERTFELFTEWREIPATVNGAQSTTPARWVFRGTIADDTATGTMTLELQQAGGERSQPFTAKRTP
jgi:hypothetical protein